MDEKSERHKELAKEWDYACRTEVGGPKSMKCREIRGKMHALYGRGNEEAEGITWAENQVAEFPEYLTGYIQNNYKGMKGAL